MIGLPLPEAEISEEEAIVAFMLKFNKQPVFNAR